MTQPEFLELCKSGQKVFEGRFMQFFDISNITLEGITFKNCNMFICTFRNCSLKNVSFENCDIYTGSFYAGDADNLAFEKCRLEMTIFDSFQFRNSCMRNCTIQWLGILNSNAAGIDLSTSSQFKVITDISQVTPMI